MSPHKLRKCPFPSSFFLSKPRGRAVIYSLLYNQKRASLVPQLVKNLPAVQKIWIWSLARELALKKERATQSSILAWRIPWTGEPGGLQSMGSQRVRHDWATDTLTDRIRKCFPYTLRKKKAKRNLAWPSLPYFPTSQALTCTVVPSLLFFYFSPNKMSCHQWARESFWWQRFQLGAAEGKKRTPPPNTHYWPRSASHQAWCDPLHPVTALEPFCLQGMKLLSSWETLKKSWRRMREQGRNLLGNLRGPRGRAIGWGGKFM